jgi:hypothetical protein
MLSVRSDGSMTPVFARLCAHFYERGSRGKGLLAKSPFPREPLPPKFSTFGDSRWSPPDLALRNSGTFSLFVALLMGMEVGIKTGFLGFPRTRALLLVSAIGPA